MLRIELAHAVTAAAEARVRLVMEAAVQHEPHYGRLRYRIIRGDYTQLSGSRGVHDPQVLFAAICRAIDGFEGLVTPRRADCDPDYDYVPLPHGGYVRMPRIARTDSEDGRA